MFSMRIIVFATAFLLHSTNSGSAKPDFDVAEVDVDQQLASLPLPSDVEPIKTSDFMAIASTSRALKDRARYLPVIAQEAAANGVPPALVDAVVWIESRYDPTAVGSIGEIGLMQVRPKTAALLGFQGSSADLAEPQTNLRYGVTYLAKAWRLAGGDLCRALMKYRAGHGSEQMSALSVEYCRRARLHLTAVGTELDSGVEAIALSPDRPQKGGVQRRRTGKRIVTSAMHRRSHISMPVRLGRLKRGIGPAYRTRITVARSGASAHQKRGEIRFVRRAQQWTPHQQLKALKSRVASR
jgi:hypothetical protein